VSFVYGLPTSDFHYALLWGGAYDRPRPGFPSWSWAGWHSLQNMHDVYPTEGQSCGLTEDRHGNLRFFPPDDSNLELQGLLVTLTERPHLANKCSQRFAGISFPNYKNDSILHITSEIAHFSIKISPVAPGSEDPFWKKRYLDVPTDFDSTISNLAWYLDAEYSTPFARLHLRDCSNNLLTYHYPRWYDHWPPLCLCFPKTLRGSTIEWLLKEGIDLVMILEIEVLEGGSGVLENEEGLRPFHLVLCLGVDRRTTPARRLGMFVLPKEVWVRARPETGTVVMG